MIENAIVFALSSSVELAQEIVEYLGLPMGKISVKHFADGEIMVEPEETVRGLQARQLRGNHRHHAVLRVCAPGP